MTQPLGIGIIGASAERGWARDAHIPALAASPDFTLRAVSTSGRSSADRAGAAYGVPAFDNAFDLVARSDVDLVVVTVKVPCHRELVDAALSAGKPVLCEWPLGNGLDETVALAARAEASNTPNFVGLQARSSAEIGHVRSLIESGFLGEVLSTSIIASGLLWGAQVQPWDTYLLDEGAGASMLMIPLGHTLDGVCQCLGELSQLSAETTTRRLQSGVIGSDRTHPITVADQIVIAGRLQSGAPISVHYRGGMSAGTNFHWEINGTEGDIVITAAFGLAQMTPLHILGAQSGEDMKAIATPDSFRWAPPGTPEGLPYNVGQAYALIARDLRDGGHRAPRFADAVVRHRMLAAVEEAARTGQRQTFTS